MEKQGGEYTRDIRPIPTFHSPTRGLPAGGALAAEPFKP